MRNDVNMFELISLAQNGNEDAKNEIIKQNYGLIVSVAKRFLNRNYEFDDLFQLGALGLSKAIYLFDFNKGTVFSTLASIMIVNEIKRFLRDDSLVKISRSLKEMSVKIKHAESVLREKNEGKAPTLSEIAEEIGESVEAVTEALCANQKTSSIYETVNEDILLIDTIENDKIDEDKILNKISVYDMCKNLSKQEKQIIMLRYYSEKTQSEIGKMLGITQVQVSRLEKKVLQKLRSELQA